MKHPIRFLLFLLALVFVAGISWQLPQDVFYPGD